MFRKYALTMPTLLANFTMQRATFVGLASEPLGHLSFLTFRPATTGLYGFVMTG